MKVVCLHDKNVLESFFRKNVYLHIYSIGDLDDFFWRYTTWYALEQNEEIQAVVLLYTGLPLPTLLALSEEVTVMQELLQSIIHILPGRFYAHLSPGLAGTLSKHYELDSYGDHYKMALNNKSLLYDVDCSQVVRLSTYDLDAIVQLYKESYPGNWFDPRMLETDQYFGIKIRDELVSVAGIHVYSEQYKVAAAGNIATHPDYRNKGYGKSVTAHLCRSLCEHVDHIGLNVKADNGPAISCYQELGFDVVASYGEYMVESRRKPSAPF